MGIRELKKVRAEEERSEGRATKRQVRKDEWRRKKGVKGMT